MEVTERELKYILQLLDGLTEALYDEIIQIYYDVIEKKECGDFSQLFIEFFRSNLKTNPVTAGCILSFFQHNIRHGDPKLHTIQNLYLDILTQKVDDSMKPEHLISVISLIKFEDEFLPGFIDRVLTKIPDDVFRQHRKQIFISLISHQRPELLRICSDHIKSKEASKEFKLTPEYMLELCYIENQHWLLEAAQVYKHQLHDMKKVTFKINNFTKQILILVLIDIINNHENYDFPSTVNQLKNIFSILNTYTSADKQLQFYITELKREFSIIKFCLENNCKLLSMGVFNQVLIQSALSVVSQLCCLSRVDRYKVSRLLSANNDFLNKLRALADSNEKTKEQTNWDIVVYNSYCAITTVIDVVTNSDVAEDPQKLSSCLDEVKRLILSLRPIKYCIEIIENIYSCLFLRYEYFSCDEHGQDYPCGSHSDCSYFVLKKASKGRRHSNVGFVCNSLTTQVILSTLKEGLIAIEDQYLAENDCQLPESIQERLKDIIKLVNHSVWKLQLVSSLTPEVSTPHIKLNLDYAEIGISSEEDENEVEVRVSRKKPRARKRQSIKSDTDQVIESSMSTSVDGITSLTGSNIEFTSLMLATPNCLVALALHQNDFTRANQIIEMFDLADAEIATEVVFTEKLRQLVAKIKNIVICEGEHHYPMKELSSYSVISTEVTSLVEGFLSSNRAPNSHEIVELARRHPHLQLYDHENAPLINVIDILLSTGLKREITYGLINIIERKISEVRNTSEVTSKKTNYIRFIEDLVGVMFEIFCSSEQSHDYVDNVCGVITDCRIPLKHKDFTKLNQHSKELEKCCVELEDIVSSKFAKPLDKNILQKYHQVYMNVVTIADKDICGVTEIMHVANKKSRVHYLRMCYIYAKNIAHLETNSEKPISESGIENAYFTVLNKYLHNLIGELIYEKNVPVSSLEPVCKKLSINLIHKLILNFCPAIPLTSHMEASEGNFNNLLQLVYNFRNTGENLFLEPTVDLAPLPRSPDPQCITYILLHNWVLAHVIKKIHTDATDIALQHSMDSRTRCLNNYMELERFDYLKALFGGNRYLASFHTTVDLNALFTFLPKLVEMGKILKCLQIIDALAEQQTLCSPNLMNLRDLLLFKLAIHNEVESNWRYCMHLKSPELKVDLILNNLDSWSLDGAMEVLEYLKFLHDPVAKEDGLYEKCNDWMKRIPLYYEISNILSNGSWYEAYEMSVKSPEDIVEMLMDSQQFKLCLDWADSHDVSNNMKNLIISNLLRQLFEYTNQATPIAVEELLTRLPISQAVDLIHDNLAKIRKLDVLQVCVNFVNEHSTDWKQFENVKIGLLIMAEIEIKLRHMFWDIIEKPLLMIEQFLMNAKLEKLTSLLAKVGPSLKCDSSGDNLYYNIKSIDSLIISRNAVDALLRFYAEKALDLKNTRGSPQPMKITDEILLQSIDSINLEASAGPFLMPAQVPSKEEWVQDYSTDKCMLCKIAIFSMIIRRHHCRRCGRLVCHACSRNRMLVPTYPPSVKLRVCDDCFKQSASAKSPSEQDSTMLSSNSESGGSGATSMDWCLTGDARRNEDVRREFSFEFTPNVTLCLTIMKMHSINLDYPRFLLDRSDEVAKRVGVGGDPRLLVRAQRSLLLAAAELYSRTPNSKHEGGNESVSEKGAAHALRCLAHADAMATLVKHACHHLLPLQGTQPSLKRGTNTTSWGERFSDWHFVRCLLEAERWELALEIATKCGLARTSVLAAWGKACLRAGCFRQAREKFAHCFRSSVQLNTTEQDFECGREAAEVSPMVNHPVHKLRASERSNSMSSIQSDGRPRTNPPLLNEVISMLENMNYPINQQLLSKAESIKATNEKLASINTSRKKLPLSEPALNIMHALASVNKIKQGDFSDFQLAGNTQKKPAALALLRRSNSQSEPKDKDYNKMDPFFYKECVYYLSNYGSHVSNIAFYMAHSDVAEVLKYCYDNVVDREVFTEAVYMECLKRDKVNELIRCMYEQDPTLETWAEYITHTCRTLESSSRLESLYALQCGTAQHARAAATCARLYARPVPRTAAPHAVMCARTQHLGAATHHLMQCVPTNKTNHKSFHLQLDKATLDKHLTTISRQMELAKFLAKCEASHRLTDKMMQEIMPEQADASSKDYRPLTLFGSHSDRIKLATIVLVAGNTVDDGFGLAYRIITDSKLDSFKVYGAAARYLVASDRFAETSDLARHVRASTETGASMLADQTLQAGVQSVVARCSSTGQLHDEMAEVLIHEISSISIKISCYLECRILTTAYILAVRHDRTNDLRRILRDAERLGNDQVRHACLKRLTAKNML